jgi:hypothetical protein
MSPGYLENTSWVDIIENINEEERYIPPAPPDQKEVYGAGDVDGYNKNKPR